MKLIYLLVFALSPVWAKPIILVSYYSPFGGAKFNNSEVVAMKIQKSFSESDIDLRICALSTVFDKAYAQIESCMKDLPESPKFVLSLGESNCNLKIEINSRNLDQTIGGADEAGVRRNKTLIIPEANSEIGVNYNLPEIYCSLDEKDRRGIQISNDAGSFVCNNTSFQLAHYYPEIPSGLIHVPANNCFNLESKTNRSIRILEDIIRSAAKTELLIPTLPTRKDALMSLRQKYKGKNPCLYDFFKRSRGVDEKNLWPF